METLDELLRKKQFELIRQRCIDLRDKADPSAQDFVCLNCGRGSDGLECSRCGCPDYVVPDSAETRMYLNVQTISDNISGSVQDAAIRESIRSIKDDGI
jgi:hypothetical protein